MNYLKSKFVKEEIIKVNEIPAILFRPIEAEEPIPTIIFYHGWGSSKEAQRLRGFILSSVGYQVLIPDAIYHGERSKFNDYSWDMAKEYFWDVIFKNLEEFDILTKELIIRYNADSKRIAVMGNSMGGFTAGGIFTHNEYVKALVVFNGSCGWELFNKNIKEPIEEKLKKKYEVIKNKITYMDPINYLNLVKDRPILMLHGDNDAIVSIESQREYHNKLKPLYQDEEKLSFIEYPNLNHFVTTNMIEESINWLGRYL